MPHDRLPFVAAVTRQLGTARRYGMQPAVLVIAVHGRSSTEPIDLAPAELQALMQRLHEPLQRQMRRVDLLLQIEADRFGVLLADAAPAAVAGICARLESPSGWPNHVPGAPGLPGRPLQLRLQVGAAISRAGSPPWTDAGEMVLAAESALQVRLA